jgi:rhodanese-related sulfurtransferase
MHIIELTVEDVQKKLESKQDFLLLDVREDDEWAAGHLPKAVHVARGLLQEEFETQCPDKQKTIIAYCARGRRSIMAAETLMNMGYSAVE